MKIQSLIASTLLVLSSTLSRADLSLSTETDMLGTVQASRMTFSAGKIRIDSEEASTIILPDSGKTLMLNHPEKTYMVMQGKNSPFAIAKEMAEKMQEGKEPVEEDAPPKITRTGKKEKIGIYDCYQVLVESADGTKEELWLSPQAPSMTDMVGAMGGKMQELAGNLGSTWMKWTDKNADLASYPVRQTAYDAEGKASYTTTLTSASKEAVAPTFFDAPADYQEQKMPEINIPNFGDLNALEKNATDMQAFAEEMEKKLKAAEQQAPAQP